MDYLVYKLLYLLLLALSFSSIIYNINSRKLNKKYITLLTITNFFNSFFLDIIKYDSLVLIFIMISIATYIFIDSRNMFYTIIITGLVVIIFALSDLFIGSIISFLLKLNRSQITENPKIYFITLFFISINSFAFSKFISIFMKRISSTNIYLKKYVNYLFLIVAYMILILIFILIFLHVYKDKPQIGSTIFLLYSFFIISSFFIVIILFWISYRNIKSELQSEFMEQEYSQLNRYTTMLEVLTNDFRKYRHDHLNIIKTFRGFIESEDLRGLKEYYNELVDESKIFLEKDKSFMTLHNIKIIPLKSLISSNIVHAQALQIELNIEISDEIGELSIKTIDICRIMGIFIDNAIEAATESEDKTIELAIIKDDENIMFKISNSCPKNTPPVFKVYKKDFSTKGPGRGLGLKIVKEIISERYSDIVILNTRNRREIFSQELIIKK